MALTMLSVLILSFGCIFSVVTMHLPCNKRRSNCCSGYMLEMNKSICVACADGFIGSRCETPCPPPAYGSFCGLLCHCNQSECDNIRGCPTEDQHGHQTDLSDNASTSTITDSVPYSCLNEWSYTGVSAECVSVTQKQNSTIVYDSKVDDWASSIRLSIIILGGLCIVMVLLHLSFSVVTRNMLQIEPLLIQIEERNII